jgi:arylsulfatase A-like enzyme
MHRLPVLRSLALHVFMLFGIVGGQSVIGATARPNVLLILTDDQGYGDLGVHGNPDVATPNLDRFARDSVQFDRFFVSSVCAPTRASLLTGRWWLRTGVCGVTRGHEVMRASEVTIAETLRAAGYRTGLFGKWHNGEQYPLTPTGQGFDEFLGFMAGHWNNYFDAELTRGTQPEQTKGFITDVLTDAAVAFVERNRANPFFCYVPYNAPHSPFQVPDRYFDQHRAKGLSPELASIYGMVESIDDNVGRLLGALDRLGLRENTIVIFLTDNGPTAVPRHNAGMRGMKASVHEGGTRVPFFVQYPARFKQPRVVREIAAHIDVYPTLLELCGVAVPAQQPRLDGVSLVPLLEGRSAGWPERMLFAYQSPGTAPLRLFPGAVRTQRHRAVLEGPGEPVWRLYDMEADPGQKSDVAAKEPAVLKTLTAAYETWWRDVTRDGLDKPSIPVGYAEHNPVRLLAPQAELSGKIKFFIPQAYANTWTVDWTEVQDKISFPIEVARPGTYEVSIAYACAEADAGARVRARSGDTVTSGARVPAAVAPHLPLAHRDSGKPNYIDRPWKQLQLGSLSLKPGRQSLQIEAVEKPGTHVLELKHVELRRVGG